MKTPKIVFSFVMAAFLGAGIALADQKDVSTAEAKKARCCEKAAQNGKDCTHACCVDAAKAGRNCEGCGGSGPIASTK